jgi:hypothetical protein
MSWEPFDPPAPSASLHFETREGETVSQAFFRLGKEFLRVLQVFTDAMDAAGLPAGRLTGEEKIQRYVDWFYRNRVCDESINHIARVDQVDRHLVRRGIAESERALGMNPYRFAETPPGELSNPSDPA